MVTGKVPFLNKHF